METHCFLLVPDGCDSSHNLCSLYTGVPTGTNAIIPQRHIVLQLPMSLDGPCEPASGACTSVCCIVQTIMVDSKEAAYSTPAPDTRSQERSCFTLQESKYFLKPEKA